MWLPLNQQNQLIKVYSNIVSIFCVTFSIHSHFCIDQIFPLQVKLDATYEYNFDTMRARFGALITTVKPLIKASIPSLEELKSHIRDCFPELEDKLAKAELFDGVMDVVRDKDTIINISCLEAIVDHYKVTEAKQDLDDFKTAVVTFCESIKANICSGESFKLYSTSLLPTHETIEFILEWDAHKCTLKDIRGLLSKAFKDMTKSVQIRAINEVNSIMVICYAPQYMMDPLLRIAKDSLDLLIEEGVIKLKIGTHIIYNKYKRDTVRNE